MYSALKMYGCVPLLSPSGQERRMEAAEPVTIVYAATSEALGIKGNHC